MIAGGRRRHCSRRCKPIRALSRGDASCCKRGADGLHRLSTGAIPDDLEDGIVGQGFPIEVYNVLGAGDALHVRLPARLAERRAARDLLRPGPTPAAPSRSRACCCSPEYPTCDELQFFLEARQPAPGAAQGRRRSTRSTGRRPAGREPPALMALAIDHRAQLEEIADDAGAPRERIGAFKLLAVEAAAQVADGRPGYGMLLDDNYGREALFAAAGIRLLDRPAGRAAGLAPAALRVRAGRSASQLDRMAGRALHQVPVLLSPGRSGRS